VRVVIGEDQALLREGLVLLLERRGFEVVGVAGDGEDLVRKARAHDPDIVIADVRMPPSQTDEGVRAALTIRASHPHIALVVLSQHVQGRYASELVESSEDAAGIGYLLKQRVADGDAFCEDLRRVVAGASVLDPEVVRSMITGTRNGPLADLTPRQLDVLRLMAEGRSNAGIAEELVLSEKAVIKHVSHIYGALGLDVDAHDHRRVLAVVRYLTA
jgi:DNA-binding NarL/FixJ family response regulator